MIGQVRSARRKFDTGHCQRCNAFSASDETEVFVRRGLQSNAFCRKADRLREIRLHRGQMWRNFRRFGDNGGIDIQHPAAVPRYEIHGFADNFETADPTDRFVGVRKMMPDIEFADRTENRIRNRVAKDVGIAVAFESMRMRNLDSAENQRAPFGKAMHVVTDSTSSRCHQSFKSITPLEAMMLYLSFMSLRGRRSTEPPAVSTKIQPAAISHKLMPCSM